MLMVEEATSSPGPPKDGSESTALRCPMEEIKILGPSCSGITLEVRISSEAKLGR
jgi:hypothetical protein